MVIPKSSIHKVSLLKRDDKERSLTKGKQFKLPNPSSRNVSLHQNIILHHRELLSTLATERTSRMR